MVVMVASNLFPILYHEHHNLDNEDLPFWFDLATQQPGPILELGCGTGRVLLPLHEAGFDILGLDLDPGMLYHLSYLAKKKKLEAPKIFQANCARFRIHRRFQLIIMPCNTFSTLSATDRKDTLLDVKNHLIPGGRFVFCIPNPKVLKKLPKESEPEVEDIFLHPSDGEPVQVSSSWRRSEKDFTLLWIYDHLLSDGTVKRTQIEIVHQLITAEDYLDEIQASGLNLKAIYGDFKKKPYKSSSSALIIQASL